MAYVYQVTHKETREFYIGSKYAMGATPDNTKDYLGSVSGKTDRCNRYKYLISNERHLLEKIILGVFEEKKDALEYEIELHRKLYNNELCLNGAKQTSNRFSASFAGEQHQMYGKNHTEQAIEKMRLAKLGKTRGSYSLEHREKIRLAQVGRKLTEEHKEKLRLAKIGETRTVKIVLCPHCKKQGGASGMTRYHFDNCKDKEQ
jgi:hypothetical protein